MIQEAVLPERRSAVRQWFKVTGPRGYADFNFICLSERVHAYYTHYDKLVGRSFGCLDIETCEYCKRNQERRYQGYVAGCTLDTRSGMVVEVSEGVNRQMLKDGVLAKSIRGIQFKFFRDKRKNKRNAAVLYNVMDDRKNKVIPPAFDVLPSLLRLWEWSETNIDLLLARMEESRQKLIAPPTIQLPEVA